MSFWETQEIVLFIQMGTYSYTFVIKGIHESFSRSSVNGKINTGCPKIQIQAQTGLFIIMKQASILNAQTIDGTCQNTVIQSF